MVRYGDRLIATALGATAGSMVVLPVLLFMQQIFLNRKKKGTGDYQPVLSTVECSVHTTYLVGSAGLRFVFLPGPVPPAKTPESPPISPLVLSSSRPLVLSLGLSLARLFSVPPAKLSLAFTLLTQVDHPVD